jgi:hypothetical protein
MTGGAMGQSDDSPVRMFPAVHPPAEPQSQRSRARRLLPAFVVVGLALLAVLATVLLLRPPPAPPAASRPGSSAPTSGTGLVATGTGAGAAGSGAGTASGQGAGGAPSPSGSGSATTQGSGTVAALWISNFQTTNNVTNWDVVITISNPADVVQTWTNASVQAPGGLSLLLTAVTPGTNVHDAGRTACVAPTGSGAVAAGRSIDIEFQISGVLSAAPRSPQLDNPACA